MKKVTKLAAAGTTADDFADNQKLLEALNLGAKARSLLIGKRESDGRSLRGGRGEAQICITEYVKSQGVPMVAYSMDIQAIIVHDIVGDTISRWCM